jgi:pimeloyl-ACP methyl ester carboxylesterase
MRIAIGRHWLRALPLAVVVLVLVAATPASANCLRPYSWVAGQTSLCKGAVVYHDYVGDDYGADSGERDNNRIGDLSPGAGDQDYPAGEEATADLIQLTIRIKDGRLRVVALLHALYKPKQTVLGVAIDTDNNQKTGGGEWKGLGVTSKGWEKLAVFKTGNTLSNRIKGTLPLPKGKRWRIEAVVANAETGKVMNVAFRPNDHAAAGENFANAGEDSSAGSFFEDDQAQALADGDISQFGYTVGVRALKHKRTRAAKPVTGMHERVYRSNYTVKPGEGMSYDGVPGRGGADNDPKLGFEQKFNFLGRYQPYGIYIPKAKGQHGMQMVFHGSGSNLSALIGQPGMESVLGEGLNRILVTPEARGTEGWGSDISERDVLDVIADVRKTYHVDRDRIFAGGYSQGGYVTYRTASLHPDLFAGAIDWVGFTGDGANGAPTPAASYTAGAIGNGIDMIKNLLNVPTVMLYAGGDELVHVWTGQAMDQAFQATDNIYRFYEHPAAEHLTFAGLDDWRKEAAYSKDRRLVRNPPRVVFTTAPFLDAPQFGIRHDHAYWLSKIRTAGGPRDYGTVDLTNAGCGGKLPVLERVSDAGDDPVPWTSDEQRAKSQKVLAAAPKLTGKLTNVASLRLDAKRTCLRGKTVTFDLQTDKPVKITFSDGRTLTLGAGANKGALAG